MTRSPGFGPLQERLPARTLSGCQIESTPESFAALVRGDLAPLPADVEAANRSVPSPSQAPHPPPPRRAEPWRCHNSMPRLPGAIALCRAFAQPLGAPSPPRAAGRPPSPRLLPPLSRCRQASAQGLRVAGAHCSCLRLRGTASARLLLRRPRHALRKRSMAESSPRLSGMPMWQRSEFARVPHCPLELRGAHTW